LVCVSLMLLTQRV